MEEQPKDKGSEHQIVEELSREAESSIAEGKLYYLVSQKWMEAWRDGAQSSPIDNSDLLDVNGHLLPQLIENVNYALVPSSVWVKLHEWYGGGPALPRKVIAYGRVTKRFEVEVYPLEIKIRKAGPDNKADFVVVVSKLTTVKQLLWQVTSMLYLPPQRCRLWIDTGKPVYERLQRQDHTLDECKLHRGQLVIVECQLPNSVWPFPPQPVGRRVATPSSRSSAFTRSAAAAARPSKPPLQVGVTGLTNLGNTCFMNSALQCLSNTPVLCEYFLSDSYKRHVNKTNPLGMKGQIAEQFATLLKRIWKGTVSSFSPSDMKSVISKYAPQFSGYRQHDSQEFLAFLLDGLHEDLNRVQKKPYVEVIESNDRADEVVSVEAWEGHLKRNQSIIVDLFQAQLKSKLTCPLCSKVSITFDPFMFLSLPVPHTNKRVLKCTVHFLDGRRITYGVKIPKNALIKDLKEKIQQLTGLPPTTMVVADIYCRRIYHYYKPTQRISSIRNSDETIMFVLLFGGSPALVIL